jgi:hypothetical protein
MNINQLALKICGSYICSEADIKTYCIIELEVAILLPGSTT